MSFSVEPYLDLDELVNDPGFKKSVRAELASFAGRPLNITPLVRDYAERLGVIHEELRSRMEEDVKASDQFLEDAIQRMEIFLKATLRVSCWQPMMRMGNSMKPSTLLVG